jgi:class 3 adenylate cyclase
MMEQQIRFCTTSDGVRIAYAIVGQGPPVVRVLAWFTHLEFEWEWWRHSLEPLAQDHLVVRYDGRGMGLSDRDVQDFSLDAEVRDLEAVIDALRLRRCALVAWSQGGPTAIAYTVRHPERVSRLVLYGSFARVPLLDTEKGRELAATMLTLIRQGWGSDVPAHRQFFTGLFMPDANADAIQWFNELQRVSASPKNAAAAFSAFSQFDVMSLLPQIKAPTLVIHRRGDAIVSFEWGRDLAAHIPGARFLPLEGRNHAMLPGEPESVRYLQAVEEFLTEEGKPARPKKEPKAAAPSEAVHTILFTDMEGSTTLTQQLGDAKGQEVLRTHNTIVRDALKACGGSEIKHTGDGIMASFVSVSGALGCAIAIQRAVAALVGEDPEMPLRVRIGLNAGEPVAENQDLFGTAVQLAARICAHAEPGQILVPTVVRELAAGKGFLLADLGKIALRGFEDPVRLYEVRWREEG